MIARSKAQREAKEGEKESGVKQKGSVLISYWLPGRRDVSLYMPAYQCEGGGEVTVNITVNRNGKVVSASMKESSTNSSCINDMAILAARNSRFTWTIRVPISRAAPSPTFSCRSNPLFGVRHI